LDLGNFLIEDIVSVVESLVISDEVVYVVDHELFGVFDLNEFKALSLQVGFHFGVLLFENQEFLLKLLYYLFTISKCMGEFF
jgi:hypothetical protein